MHDRILWNTGFATISGTSSKAEAGTIGNRSKGCLRFRESDFNGNWKVIRNYLGQRLLRGIEIFNSVRAIYRILKESPVADPIIGHQYSRLPRFWLSFLEVKYSVE